MTWERFQASNTCGNAKDSGRIRPLVNRSPSGLTRTSRSSSRRAPGRLRSSSCSNNHRSSGSRLTGGRRVDTLPGKSTVDECIYCLRTNDSSVMPHAAKTALQRIFRLCGLQVRWLVPHPAHDLMTLLELYHVDTVFDIGANAGMSGQYLRNVGFSGKIVSFEPVSHVYRQLAERAGKDPSWLCENVAIGEAEGRRRINVSGDTGGHVDAAPGFGLTDRDRLARSEEVTSDIPSHRYLVCRHL